jgi:hypothetical protein
MARTPMLNHEVKSPCLNTEAVHCIDHWVCCQPPGSADPASTTQAGIADALPRRHLCYCRWLLVSELAAAGVPSAKSCSRRLLSTQSTYLSMVCASVLLGTAPMTVSYEQDECRLSRRAGRKYYVIWWRGGNRLR